MSKQSLWEPLCIGGTITILHAHSLHPSDMSENRRKTWVKWWGCACVMRGVSLHIKQQDDVKIGDTEGREIRRGERWRGG